MRDQSRSLVLRTIKVFNTSLSAYIEYMDNYDWVQRYEKEKGDEAYGFRENKLNREI